MKLNKVTYSDLEVLFKLLSDIGNYILMDVYTTRPDENIKKIRGIADYELAKELAKKLANKMMNLEGRKHCTITLKSYEAVLFIDYLFICQELAGYGMVVYEKHINHIYKELFTRNITPPNEYQYERK